MIEIKGTDVYCPKGNTITLQFKATLDDGTDYIFEHGDVMEFRLKNTKNSVKAIITKTVNLIAGEIYQKFILTSDETDLSRDNFYYTVDIIRDYAVNTIVSAKFTVT